MKVLCYYFKYDWYNWRWWSDLKHRNSYDNDELYSKL